MESWIMRRNGPAGILMALCLITVLTGCGKNGSNDSADAYATNDLVAAENASADLEQDSALEVADREDRQAATDLFIEDADVCIQFMRLHAPEEWKENVTYHYFQDPEAGRYALGIMENSSMTATEGTGGLVFSIVLYEKYTEERGMESASYLGMLTNEEGAFLYAFLEYPSGTQYTEGTGEAYSRVLDYKDSLSGMIEGRNGYTFNTGKDPREQEEQEDE